MGRGACPSCGQKRALLWAERMVGEVLPVFPYRQLVFTIPRNLRRPFLFDRSLHGGFCRVAYPSTRDFLRQKAAGAFRRVDQAVPVMIASPQSFGDLIVHNPHLHAVVSLGLFRPDAGRPGLRRVPALLGVGFESPLTLLPANDRIRLGQSGVEKTLRRLKPVDNIAAGTLRGRAWRGSALRGTGCMDGGCHEETFF